MSINTEMMQSGNGQKNTKVPIHRKKLNLTKNCEMPALKKILIFRLLKNCLNKGQIHLVEQNYTDGTYWSTYMEILLLVIPRILIA